MNPTDLRPISATGGGSPQRLSPVAGVAALSVPAGVKEAEYRLECGRFYFAGTYAKMPINHCELREQAQHQRNAVDFSEFALEPLREDEEFILYRRRPRPQKPRRFCV